MENEILELKLEREIAVPDCFTVKLFEQNIIEIFWNLELTLIDKKHILLFREKVKELGKGKRMLIYIATIDFMAITSEAKEYSASDEGQEYTMANAVLIDNIAKKLVFNFFINMSRPKTPTKAFTTKERAIEWLLSLSK